MEAHPDISKMLLNITTRHVISKVIAKGQFDDKFVNNLLTTCVGFAVYFIFTKDLIPNNVEHKYMNNAIETCKKFGTMMVVKGILNGKKIDTSFITSISNTLIGVCVYHLIIEKYLDENNFDKKIKELLFFLTKDIAVLLLSNKNIDVNSIDTSNLIGITIYNCLVQKYNVHYFHENFN